MKFLKSFYLNAQNKHVISQASKKYLRQSSKANRSEKVNRESSIFRTVSRKYPFKVHLHSPEIKTENIRNQSHPKVVNN